MGHANQMFTWHVQRRYQECSETRSKQVCISSVKHARGGTTAVYGIPHHLPRLPQHTTYIIFANKVGAEPPQYDTTMYHSRPVRVAHPELTGVGSFVVKTHTIMTTLTTKTWTRANCRADVMYLQELS